MTLPKKKTRQLSIDGTNYRWLVKYKDHALRVSIEADGINGQLLQAIFEPHDTYSRADDSWARETQQRSIKPSTVQQIITHAIANGWKPLEMISSPFVIPIWSTDSVAPCKLHPPEGQTFIRDIASNIIGELQHDISLDSRWRKILFNSPEEAKIPIPRDYFRVGSRAHAGEISFVVFNDGPLHNWEGFIAFGIASVEFPDLVAFTYNNIEIQ